MRRSIYACDLCGAQYTDDPAFAKDAHGVKRLTNHVVNNEDVCTDCFLPIRALMIELCRKAGRLEGQKS